MNLALRSKHVTGAFSKTSNPDNLCMSLMSDNKSYQDFIKENRKS